METLNLITSRCHAMLCCLQAQAIRSMSLIQSLILYYCASQNDLKAAFPPLGATGQAHLGTLVT